MSTFLEAFGKLEHVPDPSGSSSIHGDGSCLARLCKAKQLFSTAGHMDLKYIHAYVHTHLHACVYGWNEGMAHHAHCRFPKYGPALKP